MSFGFPMFVVLMAFVFVIPQFNIRVDTEYLGLAMMCFFLVPSISSFAHLRQIIVDINKEDAEITRSDMIRMFASKTSLIIIAAWVAIASGMIIYEIYTGDKSITIGKVRYSADKILIATIIPVLFIFLDETRATYIKAVKKYKSTPLKKKKK